MPWYLVEIWAGNGQQRWNTHSITATAGSVEEARQSVAECLGLAPAHWQGNESPLELVVPSTDLVSGRVGQPRQRRQSDRGEVGAGAGEDVGAWVRLVEGLASEV
jgi:hypothetical protein